MLRAGIAVILLTSTAIANPGDRCKPPPTPGGAADDLSGSTYTWVKDDDGGMAPSGGAVVRLRFYGGRVDVDGTNGSGRLDSWTGNYTASAGTLTLKIDDLATVTNGHYAKTGDDLALPFGLTKGTKSTWHRSPNKIVARVLRGACVANAETKLLPQCDPPGGLGTLSYGQDCLFYETKLDDKVVLGKDHMCILSCGAGGGLPAEACDAADRAMEGKIAYQSADAMPE